MASVQFLYGRPSFSGQLSQKPATRSWGAGFGVKLASHGSAPDPFLWERVTSCAILPTGFSRGPGGHRINITRP